MGPRREQFSHGDRQAAERRNAMRGIRAWVMDFLRREEGPTAVEYAVMLALIIVVCIAAIQLVGSNANTTFNEVGSQLGATSGS
jgi:pilus assembly protein Flp/PilA